MNLSTPQKAFLMTNLNRMPLSKRCLSALAEAKIIRGDQLIKKTESELLRLPNFGRKSLNELLGLLADFQLKFGLTLPSIDGIFLPLWEEEYNKIIYDYVMGRVLSNHHGKQHRGLNNELSGLAQSLVGHRNVAIIMSLNGWDGTEPKTLEEVGQKRNLTRERIRQINAKFSKHVIRMGLFPPSFAKVLRFIEDHIPATEQFLVKELQKAGLVSKPTTAKAILRVCECFKLPRPSFRVGRKGIADGLVLKRGSFSRANKIVSISRKLTSSKGAVSIDELAEIYLEYYKIKASATECRVVLENQSDFEWLDEPAGWFWLKTVPRNRLINIISNIFSVTSMLSIGELRASCRRERRLVGGVPSFKALIAICERQTFLEVEGEKVRRVRGAILPSPLRGNKMRIVELLRIEGGYMERLKLVDACINHGINQNSVNVYLGSSPFFVTYFRSIISLIGVDVPTYLIERARKSRQNRPKVLKDYGWTTNRCAFVVMRATKSVKINGLCNIPTGWNKFIDGKFSFTHEESGIENYVSVSNGIVRNLRLPLAVLGLEVGDYMLLSFELNKMEVKIFVGDKFQINEIKERLSS